MAYYRAFQGPMQWSIGSNGKSDQPLPKRHAGTHLVFPTTTTPLYPQERNKQTNKPGDNCCSTTQDSSHQWTVEETLPATYRSFHTTREKEENNFSGDMHKLTNYSTRHCCNHKRHRQTEQENNCQIKSFFAPKLTLSTAVVTGF